MKTNRHSLMAKGIMILLALSVMIFAFTYSWFTDKPRATSEGISGSIESSGDFEYAIGFYNNGTGGNYKMTAFKSDSSALNLKSLQANDNVTYNLLHDYKPIDVTGDGRTLIRPSMSYGNSEINTASNDYSIAEPNVQYISFDLYFRSKTPGVQIDLGSQSWAKGGEEVNNRTLTAANITNPSTYGSFSRDAIVGAVRVAFIPYEYSSAPASLAAFEDNTPTTLASRATFIWLPRSDLHLNPNVVQNVEQMTGWTLTTNSTADVDKQHKYYNIFNNVDKRTVTYDNTVTAAVLATNSQNFSSIGNTVHFGDYYYSKVNVRIWIEGTDSEARRATSNGEFELNFQFKAS